MTCVGLVQINWDLNWGHAESISDSNDEVEYSLLPYSVGMLQAHAQRYATQADQLRWRTPIFSRGPTTTAADKLGDVDIVAFSAYVWNIEASLDLARELKRRNPLCVVVFGGPQVPDNAEVFLRENPCVDLATRGEGEITFTEILDRIDSKTWLDVSGVSWLSTNGDFQSTPPRERTKDFAELPSPYLTGVFDQLMNEHPTRRWVATWETNRGCPFACTFCDWGSATATRVYSFEMERLDAEIEWFSTHRIGSVLCCDANFGMLPRDLDIAQKIVDAKQRTGFPFSFMIQNAKNATERSYQIQKLINDSMQTIGVTLSIQSADQETLKNIRRANIRSESFQELQHRFTRDGINTYTDIIIGLPGETYDAFVDSVSTTVGFGQHNQIQFHNCSVLPNAEMGSRDYIERFGIETVPQPLRSLYSQRFDVPDIEEFLDTVVATSAMPRADWIRAKTFAWLAELLYFDRIAQIPMLLLQKRHGMSFRQVMEAVATTAAANDAPTITLLVNWLQDHGTAVSGGALEYASRSNSSDLLWPPDQQALITLVEENRLDAFMAELGVRLQTLLHNHLTDGADLDATGFDPDEERTILDEALTLNQALICLPNQPDDKRLLLSHDIYTYWIRAMSGDEAPLEPCFKKYVIKRSDRCWATLESWVESLTWNQGPNRSKYLYQVEE